MVDGKVEVGRLAVETCYTIFRTSSWVKGSFSNRTRTKNTRDGLLFELENGKPRLILLSHAGVGKNPIKLPRKHRAANTLSSRQPSCAEEVQLEGRPPQQVARSHREARFKAGPAAPSCRSSISTTDGRSTILTSSKAQGCLKERGNK
ncbi:hypothetical protein GOODEAATRI_027179, partial [Goodea atripinnis]